MTERDHDQPKDASKDKTVDGQAMPTRTTGGHAPPPDGATEMPTSIGAYRVLSELGSGGMGVVYEAEQQHPRRRVALKVVRGGQLVDAHRLRMFEREAETLARLKHPNIAAIYESGHTDEGQHFFAMELVRGDRLDTWLASRPVRTLDDQRGRLAMFRKICDAVNYAHQRGVIHRDIKPSNIIVTEATSASSSGSSIEALPGVKILDFGLARITDTDVVATLVSEVGVIKGTLAYMSPEQARGDTAEIDLRADVYSLGVILYEMLAGRRPYSIERTSLVEALRVITEHPPRPLRQSATTTARPDSDLETITQKALEKSADRRYASAAALSDDIGRYLASQPILARPPSTAYQLRKLVERNKLAAAFAATVLVLLLGFGVWMSVLYARALEAEAGAVREAETAKQVSGFLTDLFVVSDPSETRGNMLTAREILDRGARRIESELADQPEVQARMMATIGNVYWAIGLADEAEPHLRRALDIRRRVLGDDHPDTLQSINRLGYFLKKQGSFEEASSYHNDALQGRRRTLGDEHPDTLKSLHDLGLLLAAQGRPEEARPYLADSVAGLRRVLGDDHPETQPAINNMGVFLLEHGNSGDKEEAERLLREVLETRRRVNGDDHPETLTAANNLSLALRSQGRFDEAERYANEALVGRQRVLGPDHPETLISLRVLAAVFQSRGNLEEAERLFRQALDLSRKQLGNGDRATLTSLDKLGAVLLAAGKWREADSTYLELVELTRASGADALGLIESLGRTWRERGRFAEAERYFREALETRRENEPAESLTLATALIRLGIVLNGLGEYAQAEPLLRESFEIRRAELAPGHWLVPNTQSNLGESLIGQRKYEEAEPLVVDANRALADHPRAPDSRKRAAQERVDRLYQSWRK